MGFGGTPPSIGFQWVFLCLSKDFNGFQWVFHCLSKDFNGFQWVSIKIAGFTEGFHTVSRLIWQKDTFCLKIWLFHTNSPTKGVRRFKGGGYPPPQSGFNGFQWVSIGFNRDSMGFYWFQ
jgi:hypothetical protein